ncbi:hypothetical protein RFI_11005 [Reticulomyxa filosa]|uniref:Uncharacterized protein n=1 Tax=Reticulomyxa filosa TaxID=46433 RepID=X6NK72_RETFI|nr:hypothetical protein RFI_11005 [Reticulomyxa filosa]|eukprot:ETO26129.1 hypothetical protein RFI_11005 [Reticulomyxa filosa]
MLPPIHPQWVHFFCSHYHILFDSLSWRRKKTKPVFEKTFLFFSLCQSRETKKRGENTTNKRVFGSRNLCLHSLGNTNYNNHNMIHNMNSSTLIEEKLPLLLLFQLFSPKNLAEDSFKSLKFFKLFFAMLWVFTQTPFDLLGDCVNKADLIKTFKNILNNKFLF